MVTIIPVGIRPGRAVPAMTRGSGPVMSGTARPEAALGMSASPSLTHEIEFGNRTSYVTITDDLRISGEMFAAITEKALLPSAAASFPRDLVVSSGSCGDRLSAVEGSNGITINEKILGIKDDDVIRNILVQLSAFHSVSEMQHAALQEHQKAEEDAAFIAPWMKEYLVGINELEARLGTEGISYAPLIASLRSIAQKDASVPEDPGLEKRLAPSFRNLLRAVEELAEEKDGCIVSIDAPSGTGKTSLGKLFLKASQTSTGRRFVVFELDELLKFRPWRQAVQKHLLGEEMTPEQRKLLSDEDVRRAVTGQKYLTESEDFWRNDDSHEILDGLRRFIRSKAPGPYSFTVKDAYDQATRSIIPEKTYTVNRGDIIIITGKYANIPRLAPFYAMKVRLADNEHAISGRFENRIRHLSPAEANRQAAFNEIALMPSWNAYESSTRGLIDRFLYVRLGVLKEKAVAPVVGSVDTYRDLPGQDIFTLPEVTVRAGSSVGRQFSPLIETRYNRFNGMLLSAFARTSDGRMFCAMNTDLYPDIAEGRITPDLMVFDIREITGGASDYKGFFKYRPFEGSLDCSLKRRFADDPSLRLAACTIISEAQKNSAFMLSEDLMQLTLDVDYDRDASRD